MSFKKYYIVFIISFSVSFLVSHSNKKIGYAQEQGTQEINEVFSALQPNINATSIYDNGQMILGNNIKHLVILLPNDAHESPELEEEQRHIAQPYIPQKAVVSPGAMVVWFNGDVDHESQSYS